MAPGPSKPSTRVKCFSICGHLLQPNQRCLKMTDEERRWRAQFLKDQVLSPEEPKTVPEYYRATTNVFRRLYKTPMYLLSNSMKESLGPGKALFVRHVVGKLTLFLGATYVIAYYLKYHSNDFISASPFIFFKLRDVMYPNHPDYPNYYMKEAYEYYDLGFYSSVLCQDAEPLPPPPPPEPTLSPEQQALCEKKKSLKE